MGATTKPLTAKQRAFAERYAGDGVAAARAAGYGGKAAGLAVTASRLLRDPRVAAILDERRAGTYTPDGQPPAPPPEPPAAPPAPPTPPEPASRLPAEPERRPTDPSSAPRRVSVAAAVEDAEALGIDPIEVLEEIATDTTIHPSSRVMAAKALERHRRETGSDEDPLAVLRAKVTEIIRAKRARERSER